MKFGALSLAYLFLLLPALLIFFRWTAARKRKVEEKFAQASLWSRLKEGISPAKRRLRLVLIVMTVAALIFSLLQPKWGYHWEDVKKRGIDLIVAVDTSRSMLAQDIKPNRLERTKREVEDLLRLIKGDRVGLIVFSGTAFELCPLTLDYGAIRMFLNDLSIATLPRGGTNLGAAIEKALEAFGRGARQHQALLLITDGENLEGDYEEAAKRAQVEGIKIFTIGVGGEGTPIEITVPGGKSYLKDREGNIVVSKLNEAALQQIALLTGGAYHRVTAGGEELDLIYNQRIAKMNKRELEETRRKSYEHRFQWPLALSLSLLFLESILGEKKGRGWRGRIFGSLVKM